MEAQKVEFAGSPCGQHGTYTFFKSFKFKVDGKENNLAIGEFFFMKISKEIPLCIGELQLLWEDANSSHQLTSIRLYFLPENTPEGRDEYHGEDEILALHHKMILKLTDLVPMIQCKTEWTIGCSVPVDTGSDQSETEKKQDEKHYSLPQVIIQSYPQYCRFRAALKRLENVQDKWLKNALVCALGGFTTKSKNCRILYCLDTFYSSDLDELEIRCDHLAPNLKGRPRKKKLLLRKESSHDSDSSGQTEKLMYGGSPLLKPSPHKTRSQGCTFYEKNKTTEAEQVFLISLHKFMRNRNTPIERIPSLGFRQLDMYVFYKYAEKFGGYEAVTKKRLWKFLYDKLGGNPGSTSAATCTRRHYEKLLLPYEKHMKSLKAMKEKEKKAVLNKVKEKIEEKIEVFKRENSQSSQNSQRIPSDTVSEQKEKQWNDYRKQSNNNNNNQHREKFKKSQRQTVKNLLDNVSAKETGKQEWISQASCISLPTMPVKSENSSRLLEIPTVRQKTSILSPLAYRTAPKHLKPGASSAPIIPTTSTSSLYYANGYPLAASQLFAHSVIPSPKTVEKANLYLVSPQASGSNQNKTPSSGHHGGLTSPSSHPHIPYMSTTVPAHSNHKRSYSVTDIMSPQFDRHTDSKRQRLELAPPPSNHCVNSHREEVCDDEPVDFSMKTLRKGSNEKKTIINTPTMTNHSKTHPQDFSRISGKTTPQNHASRSHQGHSSSRSSSASPMSTKSLDRSVTSSDKARSKSKEAAPSSLQLSPGDVFNSTVHPAFQYAYLSQHSPTNLAANPLQIQQLYAAQFQANAAQLAAYEEMMRHQVFGQLNTPAQILISPAQIYPQLLKDGQKFGASK
ncbi:AT-rich interactive domain-containing protein 5B isoform X1 [Patella vulgata]|uniref:AT-rich interactive domain-containing protein 5B isoform X1 n=1 Tax=Patella vulgata TaxID=6465 RepID=UPI00217FBCC2|nr:AT-rich interactive domain-containing protein 5B isoform X1 [Patella vulgata]